MIVTWAVVVDVSDRRPQRWPPLLTLRQALGIVHQSGCDHRLRMFSGVVPLLVRPRLIIDLARRWRRAVGVLTAQALYLRFLVSLLSSIL